MNPNIIKAGLDSGMLNYMDLETPRYYFLHALATEEELEKFAQLIVQECAKIIESQDVDPSFKNRMSWSIKTKFGLE